MSYDLGTARGRIELEYEGRKSAEQAADDIESVGSKSRDADGKLRKLGRTLSGIGKGASIAGLAVGVTNAGVAAASLGIQLLGIIPNLASIASLASALPAALTAGAAAMGVLKAATAGVSDTLALAMDPEKAKEYAEALSKLSPEARKFAESFREAVPALKQVQQSIQEAFFGGGGFATAVPQAVGALRSLQPVLQGLAADFGVMGREVVDFATSAQSVEFVETSIHDLRSALQNASPALQPLLTGLREVGMVGSQLLPQLGNSVGNVATRFGEWLSSIANSGQLEEWIDRAITTLGELGGIASNVGSILTSVFQAANATGGGLLGTLETATGTMAAFLNSAQGSEAITSVFSGILEVARQLAPVFTTLAGALLGALGPALADLATGVGPVLLQVVQALAPAFGPLAAAAVALVNAIAPLAAPLAVVAGLLAQLASGVAQGLVAAFGPLIQVLSGGLLGAFQQLAPVITNLVTTVLPLAAQIGTVLAQAFAPLMPILVQLAQTIATSLIAYLPQVMPLFQQIVPVVGQLAAAFAGLLGPALQLVGALIPPLVSVLGTVVSVLTPIIGVVLSVVSAFLGFIANITSLPGQIGSVFSAIGSAITGAFGAVASFIGSTISSIVGFFTALPGRLLAAIQALPGQLWSFITNTVQQAAFLFGQGIGLLITAAVTLPPRILAAIAALPGQLWGLIRNAWNTARQLFTTGVSNAVAAARALPGRVSSAISSLVGQLRARAVAAWNSLRTAFVAGIATAVQLANSLPGRIVSAIGNLGSLLVSAGRDAVMGLVNGIRGAIGSAVSAAVDVGRSVINGIKSTLKISSPSKVMMELGRFINQGLVKGMLGTASQVQAAANKVAKSVQDAFEDKLITRRRRNSILGMLESRTNQMLALVKRSETIASRLKDAQKKLADVQKQYTDTYNSAMQKTKDSFNIVEAGGSDFINLDLTKESFQQALAQARTFATSIQALAKRGLNKDLLQQLVNAGAEQGGAMAAALAGADAATLKEFNDLQNKLNAESKKVGKVTADTMYGAGLQAAKGLVRGLQAQEKALEVQMRRMALQIQRSIKKALKIKSPSRVMFNLGKFTGEGLVDGLLALRREVERAAASLATSSIIPTVRLTASRNAPASTLPFPPQGSTAEAGGGNFTQNVYALPGMDSKQVADYSFTRLTLAAMGGVNGISAFTPSPKGA